jgi:hypothetical protein
MHFFGVSTITRSFFAICKNITPLSQNILKINCKHGGASLHLRLTLEPLLSHGLIFGDAKKT